MHNTLDLRNKPCPEPLNSLRATLDQGKLPLEVTINCKTTLQSLRRFLNERGFAFEEREEGTESRLLIHAPQTLLPQEPPPKAATAMKRGGYVISIVSDQMERGPEELGKILIQGFCNNIKNMNPLPRTIILYNSAVQLIHETSPLVSAFKDLEHQGVKILVCGTCANYFDMTEHLGAGQISNMHEIMETLVGASRVITP